TVGSAVDVVEDGSRQPALRRQPQIRNTDEPGCVHDRIAYMIAALPWIQTYDPLGSPWLSTLAAALPIVLLLALLGFFEWRAHRAALVGLVAALAVSIGVFGMPVRSGLTTAVYGAAYGFLPIGWIVLNAVFLYDLTVATGQFEV